MMATGGSISKRGVVGLASGELMSRLFDVLSNQYHKETNPTGVVSLGIAENSHMHKELTEFANKNFNLDAFTCTYGDGAIGSKKFRAALSNFLNERFNPAESVKPEQIVVLGGVTCINDSLAWALADEGDGFLLGAPFYGALVNDFAARSSVKAVPVHFGEIDPFGVGAIDKYEAALLKSQQSGTPIRAVVIINPHNPLGKCFPRETLVALLQFCQKHRVHLISDEIYALSVFENKYYPNATKFTSVLSINLEGLIDRKLVHVLYGVSKDFCANGLRIGSLISQYNEKLIQGLRAISMFAWPSGPADHISTRLLESRDFVDSFIATNQQRLAASYEIATTFLQERGIKYYTGGNAGFFLWVDLRFALPPPTDEHKSDVARERVLAKQLLDGGLYLATGEEFRSQESGWFRIVFSHPKEYLLEGLQRLAMIIGRG